MATLKLASVEQKSAYRTLGPVYPLYGYVTVGGRWCPVEDLRAYAGSDEPKYEITAPPGLHFAVEGTHSILCRTRDEIFLRASSDELTPCTEICLD